MSSKTSDTHSDESKANIFWELANRYHAQKMWANAEDATVKALEIFRRLKSENSEIVGWLEYNLGLLLVYQEKFDKAEVHIQKALNVWIWSGQRTDEIANAYCNLGRIYAGKGRISEAEEMHKKSLEFFEHLYGKNHRKVGFAFNNLGSFYVEQEKYDEAEIPLKRALEIQRQHPTDKDLASVLRSISAFHLKKGDRDKAMDIFKEYLRISPTLQDHDDGSGKISSIFEKRPNL